jgi:alkanesulfonate monooxygenase SsuD/methylene tetrahydromethanopterin reductase-like flavin-dependent oxidoreductase (luciferase family)
MTDAVTTGSARVPRLEAEPEVVKFLQCDALQYEGDWDPDRYDPHCARETFESHIEDAVEAERLGFDGIFTIEHHFDGWTTIPSPNLYLAAVAMRTSRLLLGQSVSILPFHNPWRLAEEVGMLDMISNGRMQVGVGKGNFSTERATYGYSGEEIEARFAENLELLTRALSENRVTFKGRYTTIERPATMYPKPFGPPLRPWVAALRPESVETIGRSGNNLYGILGPGSGGNLERYVDAARQAGHERSGANYLTTTSIIIAPTDREALRLQERAGASARETLSARGLPPEEVEMYAPLFGGAIAGSPQTVLDRLAEGLSLTGARRLMLIMRLRSMPREVSRQTRHLFSTEIMPHLRNFSA